MNVRPLLLLPALALTACNLTSNTEGGTGMAQERQCESALNYGGCVQGTASKDQHGYHLALLRRGDQIRVRMTRLSGDINPGLALKSPKYSIAVRHESVQVATDDVAKTWTVQSTGFYTFVAFPWSNRGTGSYQIDLDCVGGPCLDAAALDAEVAGACIGEARDCTLRALSSDAEQMPEDVGARFEQCLRADAMPSVCGGACAEANQVACQATVDRIRPFAGRGAECIEQVQNCIGDCVPLHTTTAEIPNLSASPEMFCWAIAGRTSCADFGMGLASCRDPEDWTGTGYEIGTQDWCEAICVASEGDDNVSLCEDYCTPQPGADDETPDPESAE